jgi:hypothetical protein
MSKAQKQQPKQTKVASNDGLSLNKNAMKRYIKQYYKDQGIDYSKVSGGHVAMAAMLESMTRLIIEKCEKEVAFNKSGLREITREGMNSALLRNTNEYGYFIVKANDFNEKFEYAKMLPIEKEMEQIYAEQKSSSFSPQAKNYMYYLLYSMFTNIAITCSIMMDYAGSKMLTGNCIINAVKIEFPKTISVVLAKNIESVLKLQKENPEEESETEQADAIEGEEEEEVAEEPKKETKKGPVKNETKQTTPKAATTTTAKKNTQTKKPLEVTEDEEPEDEPEVETKQPPKKPSKNVSTKPSKK